VEKPIQRAVAKLVLAGEQAGFSVEQMIQLLGTGTSVETLLHWIERGRSAPVVPTSLRWIM
jgi:hypothetical protein